MSNASADAGIRATVRSEVSAGLLTEGRFVALLDEAQDPDALARWAAREGLYPVLYRDAGVFRRDIKMLKARGILPLQFVYFCSDVDEDVFEWMDAQGIECDILPEEPLE